MNSTIYRRRLYCVGWWSVNKPVSTYVYITCSVREAGKYTEIHVASRHIASRTYVRHADFGCETPFFVVVRSSVYTRPLRDSGPSALEIFLDWQHASLPFTPLSWEKEETFSSSNANWYESWNPTDNIVLGKKIKGEKNLLHFRPKYSSLDWTLQVEHVLHAKVHSFTNFLIHHRLKTSFKARLTTQQL